MLLVLRAKQERCDFPKFISKAFRGAKWPTEGHYSDEIWARTQMIEERPIDRMIRLLVEYGAIVPISFFVRKACWDQWEQDYEPPTLDELSLRQIYSLEQYLAIDTPHQTLEFILQQTCTDGRLRLEDDVASDITAALYRFNMFFLSSFTLCRSYRGWTLSAEEALEQDVEMAFNFLEKLRLLKKYVLDEYQAFSLTNLLSQDLLERAEFIGKKLRDEDEDSGEEDVSNEVQSQCHDEEYHEPDSDWVTLDEWHEYESVAFRQWALDAGGGPQTEEEQYIGSFEESQKYQDGYTIAWLTSIYKKSPELARELIRARLVIILEYTGFYPQPSLETSLEEQHYRKNLKKFKADCPELFEMRKKEVRNKVLATPGLLLSNVDEEVDLWDPADLCDV